MNNRSEVLGRLGQKPLVRKCPICMKGPRNEGRISGETRLEFDIEVREGSCGEGRAEEERDNLEAQSVNGCGRAKGLVYEPLGQTRLRSRSPPATRARNDDGRPCLACACQCLCRALPKRALMRYHSQCGYGLLSGVTREQESGSHS